MTFGILRTGARGLQQNQAGLQVTAKNVSSAGVDGYTRRMVTTRPSQLDSSNGGSRRVLDTFIERRLLGANAAKGEATAERLGAAALDDVFAESEGGLGASLDAFQASIHDLSSQPSDPTTRSVVLARAQQLGQAFSRASASISEARETANDRITQSVGEVNTRLASVGSLNQEIMRAESDGNEASDLRDERDKLVREISAYVPVTVLNSQEGGVTLTLPGGQPLVSSDGSVSALSAVRGDDGNVQVYKNQAGQMVDVSATIDSGEIRGYLNARDEHLTAAAQKLDQLAFDVAKAYNDVHSQGVGLDEVGGRNLFEPFDTVAGAASALAVSSDVAGDPSKLAAASDVASLPSGNEIARKMQALASAPIAFGGGMTATEALASLVGSVGVVLEAASTRETMADASLSQVESMRDGISAVSSDEEMVAMMRYQRGYEASLKVVQVADQLLEQLVNLRR